MGGALVRAHKPLPHRLDAFMFRWSRHLYLQPSFQGASAHANSPAAALRRRSRHTFQLPSRRLPRLSSHDYMYGQRDCCPGGLAGVEGGYKAGDHATASKQQSICHRASAVTLQ
jgi:hypothetical protein